MPVKVHVFVPKGSICCVFAVVVCGEKEPDAFEFGDLNIFGMALPTAQVNA